MNIAILGAGALGCLFYAKLCQQQFKPAFIADLRKKTGSEPSKLQYQDGLNTHEHELRFIKKPAELEPYSAVLITLKSHQVLSALQKLRPWLNHKQNQLPVICLLHNGMGIAQEVETQFPKHKIILATTSQAALKTGPYAVQHTGIGPSYFGQLNTNTAIDLENNALYQQIKQSLELVQQDEHIENRLYQKLSINCIINPLTAIHQCKNGHLSSSDFLETINELCQEIALVYQAIGIKTNKEALFEQVINVIMATRENYSSMNRDVFFQRPTEIEHITGHLLQLAKKNQIASPLNQDLYNSIKKLEQDYL